MLIGVIRARWFIWIAGAIVVTAAIATYIPGLSGPFVFDDASNIALNPSIRVDAASVTAFLDAATSTLSGPLGRPVSMLSFGINYYFNRFDPLAFKATNLAIHLVTGLALFLLTRRLLLRLHGPGRQRYWEAQRITWLSLGICAAWLIHPLNLTSVLYVVQRMTALAGMFTAFGVLGYTIGREQLDRGERSGLWTITACVSIFGVLAILSKETGALLLLYIAVVELTIFRFQTHRSTQTSFRLLWAMTVSVAVLSASILAYFKLSSILAGYQVRTFDMTDRLLTEARALWFYLRHILLPDIGQLSVYHDDFLVSRGLLEPPTTLLSIFGVAALCAIAIVVRHRQRWLSFGIAWFLAGHLLESTILPLLLIQEHRNYLAQYGILACVIYYICYPHPTLQKSLQIRYGLAIAFVALLGMNTLNRSNQWKDEWTLYNAEVRNHPDSAQAHSMLGILFHDNNMFLQAEQHLNRAVALAPDRPEFVIQLVQHLFISRGDVPQNMIDELSRRLANYPFSNVTLWVYQPLLFTVRSNSVLHRKLCEIFEKTLERSDIKIDDPSLEEAYGVLGHEYVTRGDHSKALKYLERALQLIPRAEYYLARANIYLAQGKKDQAKAVLLKLHEEKIKMSDAEKEELTRLEKIIGPVASWRIGSSRNG